MVTCPTGRDLPAPASVRWPVAAAPGNRLASAARAQVWFEWRSTGNSLPIMTALLLPVTLLFLVFGHNDVVPTAQPLLGALAVPVFLAGLAGITAGHPSWIKNYAGGTPVSATLPLSTVGLVAAKLRAAARSTLASWAW